MVGPVSDLAPTDLSWLSLGTPAKSSPRFLLRLVLFGAMEAWGIGGAPMLPRSRKTRALLAILAMARGQPVARASLAALLWSGRGEEQRRGSLRQTLHELQDVLAPLGPPMLITTREAVALRSDLVWTDAIEADIAPPTGTAFLSDLDGLDPAFDRWLAQQRRHLSGPHPARTDDQAVGPLPEAIAGASLSSIPQRAALRGARIGIPPIHVLGAGIAPHLSHALAQEISVALARFRWLFVADSTSLAAATQRYGGEEDAARALGIDLLLTGTLSSDGNRLRLSLRLIDLRETGSMVWMERIDRDAVAMPGLRDEIASAIVARLDPEILRIETSRASSSVATTSSCYDLLLRAIVAIHRIDRDIFTAAGVWLREAMALEPNCAAAHAWYAYWHLFLIGQGWATDSPALIAEAGFHASLAVALDPLDAHALTIAGHVRAFLHHEVEEATVLHDRALALNPNLAMAWVFSGMTQSYLGRHEEALRRLDRYALLAPFHPHAFYFDAARGLPLLYLRRHEEVVQVERMATAMRPGFSYPYKTYLSALGHLGMEEEAAEVRAKLLAIEPDFCIEKAQRRTPTRRPEDIAHYIEGLRRAGLE
jgi:TolB-like protein